MRAWLCEACIIIIFLKSECFILLFVGAANHMMQEFPLEMIKFCEMCKKKKKQGVLRVEEWYISTGPFTIIELLPKRVIFFFSERANSGCVYYQRQRKDFSESSVLSTGVIYLTNTVAPDS